MCETTDSTAVEEIQEAPKADNKKAKFQLVYGGSEVVCLVQLDPELLGDPEFINPNTGTFTAVKNGSRYTIYPMDDPTIQTLVRVRRSYDALTKQPFAYPSAMTSAIDELVATVGLLFGEAEFYDVNDLDDMNKLINPRSDVEPPATVKHTILGDLLADVVSQLDSEKDDKAPEDDEADADSGD